MFRLAWTETVGRLEIRRPDADFVSLDKERGSLCSLFKKLYFLDFSVVVFGACTVWLTCAVLLSVSQGLSKALLGVNSVSILTSVCSSWQSSSSTDGRQSCTARELEGLLMAFHFGEQDEALLCVNASTFCCRRLGRGSSIPVSEISDGLGETTSSPPPLLASKALDTFFQYLAIFR